MAVTKTLGPLHLEDLEPHRFEDLIRQLLYDFRPWRDLEATGRTGSDEGFDARAWEMVGDLAVAPLDEEDTDEPPPERAARQWLVQCKREKAIGPKKIETYLNGLPSVSQADLYGIIFVAACDFSIASRDLFYRHARELGFQEVKLWGKAEVEDLLFQPKNDHLLFAYFGVSLQVRKRSVQTAIRARLMMKRKARKHLQPHSTVVIVDATDDRYPYLDEDRALGRAARGRWIVCQIHDVHARGIRIQSRRHFAFIDDNQTNWDFAERMNDAIQHEDAWNEKPENPDDWKLRSDAMARWEGLESKNKGWFETQNLLPFEAIIDIDPDGDEDVMRAPVIYTQPFKLDGRPPFADYYFHSLQANEYSPLIEPSPDTRIAFFEREPPDGDRPQTNGIA